MFFPTTDTALIGAAAIGTMFILSRLLDGFTDFLMGGIIDKTNTKWGKARPWLILSAPLMVIGIILILSVPSSWSSAMKLVYAYITYIFLNCIVYTIFGIAHTALLARMTRDVNERNTTSVVSSICNNLSGLVIGTAITYLQLHYGWLVTSIILGVTAGILILIPELVIKETVGMVEDHVDSSETLPLKQQLPAVLKNRYFYLSLLLGAFTLLMNANAIASQVYYCNVVLGEPEFMMQLMSLGQLPGIIVLFFMPWFSKRFSKRGFMLIGASILIFAFVILGFAGSNHTLLLLGTILRSIGVGPMFAGIYALIADTCDYGEWKTGIRSEGLMSSSQSIGSKVGIGFGSAITGWVLAAVHYDATALTQSQAVIRGITFDYSWLGAIISVLLFICVLFMDVEKYLPQIQADLAKSKY
ncbi:glycoside-pentoside-hexuronide (GPH):cation symporter [uncultured Streptococcus sp.]|uniref:MFS transporter n=1 Tax=uncultured Streptococcus sp. TaxID=83427 RepID=UPI0028E19A4A|nr:glycoside-pentoside-hexuronide (GPH):cation symporter [uncultured Streptococcus sp.]